MMKFQIALAASAVAALAGPGHARQTAPADATAPVPAPTPGPATPVATPVAAAPAPVDPAATAPACELHVFPTLEGQAVTTGWLSGFGAVGAVAEAIQNKDRNISEAEYLKEALGPRLQVQALKAIDLPGALKLPPSKIVYETPIADRKITTAAKTRLSPSAAPCYAEIIVTQNFYTKRAIYGRSLNNRFVFKDFRNGVKSANLFKGRGGNGLTSFPPKTTDETEAAENDLRDAFTKNFLEFSKTVLPAK